MSFLLFLSVYFPYFLSLSLSLPPFFRTAFFNFSFYVPSVFTFSLYLFPGLLPFTDTITFFYLVIVFVAMV